MKAMIDEMYDTVVAMGAAALLLPAPFFSWPTAKSTIKSYFKRSARARVRFLHVFTHVWACWIL